MRQNESSSGGKNLEAPENTSELCTGATRLPPPENWKRKFAEPAEECGIIEDIDTAVETVRNYCHVTD